MDWRLKRIDALGAEWASVDGFGSNRQWYWTSDEAKAFSAHNRYIVEAMQRRMPDWMRYSSELEPVPNGDELEERAPVKRTAKREATKC